MTSEDELPANEVIVVSLKSRDAFVGGPTTTTGVASSADLAGVVTIGVMPLADHVEAITAGVAPSANPDGNVTAGVTSMEEYGERDVLTSPD